MDELQNEFIQAKKPEHYSGPADVLDLLAGVGKSELIGFCVGNVLKYVFRAGRKARNGTEEDLNKAAYYLDLLRAVKWYCDKYGSKVDLPRPVEILKEWRANDLGTIVG